MVSHTIVINIDDTVDVEASDDHQPSMVCGVASISPDELVYHCTHLVRKTVFISSFLVCGNRDRAR